MKICKGGCGKKLSISGLCVDCLHDRVEQREARKWAKQNRQKRREASWPIK